MIQHQGLLPLLLIRAAQEEEIDKLKDKVKVLEDKEDVDVTQSGDNAPIKGRSINKEEAAAERISNDSEEVARVLTSMDATTVLAGGIDVPTGSGFIPTVGPPATVISTGSEVGPTSSLIVTRRKGKEVMVESDTPKKKKLQEQIDAQVARELEEQQEKENIRMNEQIARDAEVARIHAEEELQGMIDSLDKSNETIAKLSMSCEALSKEIFIFILCLRNLKLRDEDGIVFIPDTELFENLTLMGIVPLFDTMLVHQGEGSGTQTDPHHTPFPEADTSSHPTTSSIPLPSIPTAPIPPVTQPDPTPIRQYSRRARIAQSSALLTIADEPASPERDVSKGEACPTDSGFIADLDRATIAKSSTLPYDSAPRVTSPVADKGNNAPIKGRSINKEEAATERISNDSEEVARVLTSMDATTVLAGGIDVPTGSSFIPTAGPPATVISTGSEVGPTSSSIVIRRKGKEVMVESDTPKKKKLQEQIDAQVARELEEQQEKENIRMNEQIARDAEVARIHAEEELQGMIDSLDKSNETIAKLKRKGLNLEKEQVKKQKSSEEAPKIETSIEEFTKDKMKEMMQPAISEKEMELWVELKRMYEPDPEDQLWTLTQNFMHAPVEWKLYDLSGVHHLTAKDKDIFMLVEKHYPLRRDEPASLVKDVSEGKACPTDSGFIADQDRATIAKSSTLPHDSTPRVTSPAADEGKEEIVKLKDRVKVLEDKEDVAATQSRDDAPIKERSINEGEAATERISNDSEEVAKVLTSMDAATVLAGGIDVPTGSGFIPTADPPATVISTGSKVGPTASPIFTRRKGKEVMVESDTPKKKKLQEQIDAQVARELEEKQEKENMRMNE
nr:hypothetical protein [Tanacetum cinerariifolium]